MVKEQYVLYGPSGEPGRKMAVSDSHIRFRIKGFLKLVPAHGALIHDSIDHSAG